MTKAVFAAATVAIALAAGEANAQFSIPLSVEGRVDYAVPVGDFDDSVDEGISWGAGVSLGIAPGLGLYGTYSQTEFAIENVEEAEVQDKGFSVGLTTALPRVSGISPWVGAGLVIHEFDFNDEDGGSDDDDGIEEDIGFEVGGGLAIPLAPNIRLTPGIGYRQYGVDVGTLLGEAEFDVQYFTAGVGLNLSF
jgi:opacity protein-like surface antigen